MVWTMVMMSLPWPSSEADVVRKVCHHFIMVVMLTTVVLDVLRAWSSDRVFKSRGKSANFHYFHLIEWLCFYKTKLVPWILPRQCMQMAQKCIQNIIAKGCLVKIFLKPGVSHLIHGDGCFFYHSCFWVRIIFWRKKENLDRVMRVHT